MQCDAHQANTKTHRDCAHGDSRTQGTIPLNGRQTESVQALEVVLQYP